MRISNEQYLIFAGIFQLVIATTYVLICISNYSFEWLDYESLKSLADNELLKIKSQRNYDPNLTWGLAGFNGIVFIVYWVIWRENEINKKTDFTADTFGIGTFPFLIAVGIYFLVDYRNDLIFAITGSYAIINLTLYLSNEIRGRQNVNKS